MMPENFQKHKHMSGNVKRSSHGIWERFEKTDTKIK